MLSHISHAYHNFKSLISGDGFSVEDGEFGRRLVANGKWDRSMGDYMLRHGIKELRVSFNPVKRTSVGGLSFLEQCPWLEGLVILDHAVSGFNSIGKLLKLRSLSIAHGNSNSDDVFVFSGLRELERLYLGESVPNIMELFQCKGLKRLALSRPNKNFSSASFADLENLEFLSVSAATLMEVANFGNLRHLVELNISALRGLSSLSGVEGLLALRRLKIESCSNIKSIEPLRLLTALELVWLYDCGYIQSLRPLAGSRDLIEINIGGTTNIEDGDIDFITELPNLRRVGFVHRKHYSLSKDALDKFIASKNP